MTNSAKIFPGLLLATGIAGLTGCQTAQEKPPLRPNILFCISDDQSFPHAGSYGCTWVKTPAFDRVAREGILFTNAYTPNAKGKPSRPGILTGHIFDEYPYPEPGRIRYYERFIACEPVTARWIEDPDIEKSGIEDI